MKDETEVVESNVPSILVGRSKQLALVSRASGALIEALKYLSMIEAFKPTPREPESTALNRARHAISRAAAELDDLRVVLGAKIGRIGDDLLRLDDARNDCEAYIKAAEGAERGE